MNVEVLIQRHGCVANCKLAFYGQPNANSANSASDSFRGRGTDTAELIVRNY